MGCSSKGKDSYVLLRDAVCEKNSDIFFKKINKNKILLNLISIPSDRAIPKSNKELVDQAEAFWRNVEKAITQNGDQLKFCKSNYVSESENGNNLLVRVFINEKEELLIFENEGGRYILINPSTFDFIDWLSSD